jgi:5-methylcytosine-specific restriction endonuclease McrA
VQPELRKLVLKRDNYTCIKCKKTQDELKVGLHCHHIEGIRHNPIESADVDICVTLCKNCHKKVHKQKGCTYNDFQCKE